MTLSLDDVRSKRFRMARKNGYEVHEVDEFVDEIEESFAALVEENASLKKQVDALRSGDTTDDAGDVSPVDQSVAEPTASETAPTSAAAEEPAPTTESPSAPAPVGPVGPVGERIVVTASAEASSAVVRLVQLSTEQAEHLVNEATADATRIRDEATSRAQQVTDDARTRADRLESEARVNAERVEADAQGRSAELDQEVTSRRQELFGDLERERTSLSSTVERLRSFEAHYRSQLTDHLKGQLAALDHAALEPEGGPEPTSGAAGSDTAAPVPDGSSDGTGNGTSGDQAGASDTPRLDALLGDQR